MWGATLVGIKFPAHSQGTVILPDSLGKAQDILAGILGNSTPPNQVSFILSYREVKIKISG